MMTRHSAVFVLLGTLVAATFASPVQAQPFVYVLGQRDDPAPGNSGPSTVSVINAGTNTIVGTIEVGISCSCVNPDGLVMSRDGARVYVSNEVAKTVSVINTATNTVINTINVGVSITDLAISPDGETLFVVAQPAQMSVYIFSTATGILEGTIPLSVPQAIGAAVSPDGTRLYVGTYGSNSIKVINTASLSVVATVPVGNLPMAFDISPNGATLYVANYLSHNVSVISTATNAVVTTIPVGTNPSSARVTPNGSRVYVTNTTSNNVSIIDAQTNAVVGSPVAVTFNPRNVKFTADGARAYVANSQNVQVINTSTLAVTPTISFSSTTHGSPAALAITPAATTLPTMRRDKSWLRFAAIKSGTSFVSQTSTQLVRLTQSGAGTVNWTATPTQPWLQVSPSSGTGTVTLQVSVVATAALPATGTLNAAVLLTITGASPANATLPVTLTLLQNGTSLNPFGSVDTPTNNTTGVTGAVPFTGWALDDVEIDQVSICRAAFGSEFAPIDQNCGGAAQIFVGFGVFIDGARPDVHAAFPTRPRASRAGWGFMVLTNMLPSQGNGTYQFLIWARDRDGHAVQLGTRTITCANHSATKPFGAIDTPGQGAVANGSSYVNFGWALTPLPKTIPTDGSTISVLIDGAPVGNVTYNNPRPDIQSLFPGLNNTNGAIGFRVIDTTALSNGLHTISWTVIDDQGTIEGIGSRFFSVSNGASALTAAEVSATAGLREASVTAKPPSQSNSNDAPLRGRRGWNLQAPLETFVTDRAGRFVVRSEEVNRIELHLGDGAHVGHLRTHEGLTSLPAGSRIDAATGTFTWAPGVGFVGTYDLVFVSNTGAQFNVRVILQPKGSHLVGPQLVIDLPRPQQLAAQPFVLTGWTVDLSASQGTGIATVHAWAYPVAGGPPIFLGATGTDGPRPDVAAVHGDQFRDSGFGLVVQGLAAGEYDLAVFPWSTQTASFVLARTVRVTVR